MLEFGRHEFERLTLDMDETGRKIRQAREVQKIPVQKIAEYLSISPQSVYNWEIGKSLITVPHLIALSDILKTPFNNLIVQKTEKAEYCDYLE